TQYENYLLLESSYITELNNLKDEVQIKQKLEFNNYEIDKINQTQIDESVSTIITRLDQSFFEAFLWESVFDLIFVFFLEFLLVVIFAFVLIAVLFSGNIRDNSR